MIGAAPTGAAPAAPPFREGVSFTPGGAMTVEGDGLSGLRLSFSVLDEQEIDEGIRRMATAIRAVRRSTGSGSRIAPALS